MVLTLFHKIHGIDVKKIIFLLLIKCKINKVPISLITALRFGRNGKTINCVETHNVVTSKRPYQSVFNIINKVIANAETC